MDETDENEQQHQKSCVANTSSETTTNHEEEISDGGGTWKETLWVVKKLQTLAHPAVRESTGCPLVVALLNNNANLKNMNKWRLRIRNGRVCFRT